MVTSTQTGVVPTEDLKTVLVAALANPFTGDINQPSVLPVSRRTLVVCSTSSTPTSLTGRIGLASNGTSTKASVVKEGSPLIRFRTLKVL